MSQPSPAAFPSQPGWPTAAPPAIAAEPASVPPAPPSARPDAGAAPRRRTQLALALAVVAGVVAGAVATAFLVTAAFISAAEEIGRGMSEGLRSDIGRSVGEGFTQSLSEDMAGSMRQEGISVSTDVASVELHEPVAPGDLGPDPALNAYARSCFAGDYHNCDVLFAEAPPLSEYENYGGTCAGRVKADELTHCTDLV